MVSGPSANWEKIFLGCRLAAGLISRGRVPRPGSDTGRGRSSTHPGCRMRRRLAPAPRTPQAPPWLRAEVSTTQRRPGESLAGFRGASWSPWSRGNENGMRGLRGREEEESTGNGRATDDIPRPASIPDVVSRTYLPFSARSSGGAAQAADETRARGRPFLLSREVGKVRRPASQLPGPGTGGKQQKMR